MALNNLLVALVVVKFIMVKMNFMMMMNYAAIDPAHERENKSQLLVLRNHQLIHRLEKDHLLQRKEKDKKRILLVDYRQLLIILVYNHC